MAPPLPRSAWPGCWPARRRSCPSRAPAASSTWKRTGRRAGSRCRATRWRPFNRLRAAIHHLQTVQRHASAEPTAPRHHPPRALAPPHAGSVGGLHGSRPSGSSLQSTLHRESQMNAEQVEELVLQSLAHEKGGMEIYTTALQCVLNEDLKDEWQRYLEQARTHVSALEGVCQALGIDPTQESPGRDVVRGVGQALVQAMQKAQAAGDASAAEIVACEAVVLAEAKALL